MELNQPFTNEDRGKILPGTIVIQKGSNRRAIVLEGRRSSGEEDIEFTSGSFNGSCLGSLSFFTPVYIPDPPVKVGDKVTFKDCIGVLPPGSIAQYSGFSSRWRYLITDDDTFLEVDSGNGRVADRSGPRSLSDYLSHPIIVTYINN